jgi:hypothetical protein
LHPDVPREWDQLDPSTRALFTLPTLLPEPPSGFSDEEKVELCWTPDDWAASGPDDPLNPFPFLVHDDGSAVEMSIIIAIRESNRQHWNLWRDARLVPASFAQANIVCLSHWINSMYGQYPCLSRCVGHYKLRYIATKDYPMWYRTYKKHHNAASHAAAVAAAAVIPTAVVPTAAAPAGASISSAALPHPRVATRRKRAAFDTPVPSRKKAKVCAIVFVAGMS